MCGWDLFHAHLFVFTTGDADDGDSEGNEVGEESSCDKSGDNGGSSGCGSSSSNSIGGGDRVTGVGLLFHAKEHPREFTLSATAIRDVGSELTGGARDPRTNTQLSVLERSFCERNAIWLSTTNETHILLPSALGFPVALLSPFGAYHFATVSETALTDALGPICDINYFADAAQPQAPTPISSCRPEGVAISVYEPHASALQRRIDSTEGGDTSRDAEKGDRNMVPASPTTTPVVLPEPPLNEKVAAILRMQLRRSQIEASARFERMLAGKPTAPSRHGSGLWVCLVGGEWAGAMHQDEAGTRPGAWLGSHSSLQARVAPSPHWLPLSNDTPPFE